MCAYVIHFGKNTGKAYIKVLCKLVFLSGTIKVILIFFFLFICSDHILLFFWKNNQTFKRNMLPQERLPKPEIIQDLAKKTKGENGY